jgi:transcriptional regulator GlxA family with amidase domain
MSSTWSIIQTVAQDRPPTTTRRQRSWHYRSIVKRITRLARTSIDVPIHIADLCRLASVSQRTLRNAFQVVHGVTPYRYLRTVRMVEARKALLSPDSETVTVTETATRFGFFELGRFAVEYRRSFGESPSATLRRASAARAARKRPPIATAPRQRAAEQSCSPP